MASSILAILLGVVKLLGIFTQLFHDKQLISAGEAQQLAKALQAQSDDLNKAIEIRNQIHTDLSTHPDRVRDPDKFQRKS